jgi:hypothetical protein
MTERELYRNVLIELNKEEASALYVEDFLYYANKGVNWFLNNRYHNFEITQQLTDDLRSFKKGPETIKIGEEGNLKLLEHPYRHMLNCIVTISLDKFVFGCEQTVGTTKQYAAKKLTSDKKAAIVNNEFLKPTFYRPYFDIIGENLNIYLGDGEGVVFEVNDVSVEYLKNAKEIKLTPQDLLEEIDPTDELEFSEEVAYEIVNIIVGFILEQGGNPRIQTHAAIHSSGAPASKK